MKKTKKPKAYCEGWLDACLACIQIVRPIPHVEEERECADIAAELLEMMIRKHSVFCRTESHDEPK